MEKYVSNITNQHQALTLVEENTIKSRNLQLRWCQQEGRIGGLLLTCPLCNCNLVVIHKQKWICGNFGIQEEDCETPVGSKTKEAHFDMAGYAQLAVSLTIFPFIKPKKIFISLWTQLWLYLALILPWAPYVNGLGKIHASGNRPADFDPSYQPWSWPVTSSSPSWLQPGSSWRQDCGTQFDNAFWNGPVTGLQPLSTAVCELSCWPRGLAGNTPVYITDILK